MTATAEVAVVIGGAVVEVSPNTLPEVLPGRELFREQRGGCQLISGEGGRGELAQTAPHDLLLVALAVREDAA